MVGYTVYTQGKGRVEMLPGAEGLLPRVDGLPPLAGKQGAASKDPPPAPPQKKRLTLLET